MKNNKTQTNSQSHKSVTDKGFKTPRTKPLSFDEGKREHSQNMKSAHNRSSILSSTREKDKTEEINIQTNKCVNCNKEYLICNRKNNYSKLREPYKTITCSSKCSEEWNKKERRRYYEESKTHITREYRSSKELLKDMKSNEIKVNETVILNESKDNSQSIPQRLKKKREWESKFRKENRKLVLQKDRDFYQNNLEKMKKKFKEYQEKNPDKVYARNLVNWYIRSNRLKRAKEFLCVDCKKQAVLYHHEDYLKPLEVTPLCKSCHTLRHGVNNER